MWLRSMALDVNISPADRRYAFEEYSDNSYLYLLAFLQVLVGDAPYGVHLLSTLAYLAAAVWLFRFCRRAFGSAPAALTLAGVLFLPTLFFWSISALRESLHLLLTLAAIVMVADAAATGRPRDWVRGIVVAGLAAYALKDLRVGSMMIVTGSLVIGTAAAFVIASPRRLAIGVPAAIAIAVAILALPSTQARVLTALRSTALSHQGHAWTAGVHYKVLDSRFYVDRTFHIMDDMTPAEAARYAVRALTAAAVVPLPWQASTRQLQVYLAEHVIWLSMMALLPLGFWAAARRHPAGACIITTYIILMFTAIALTSGNIGTLVRHRGLILPFVICIAAVATCHVLARAASHMEKRTVTNGVD
jgi:dolichyl-phosphate-mannose-protein mannosyltransferase